MIKHIKNQKKCTQKYKKMQKTHRNCKKHTKNAKNDISGITPITSFHHIGDNRYYCDILESVPTLTNSVVVVTQEPPVTRELGLAVQIRMPMVERVVQVIRLLYQEHV
jgi:hypothetical protein